MTLDDGCFFLLRSSSALEGILILWIQENRSVTVSYAVRNSQL
jgi:hypothetical protein